MFLLVWLVKLFLGMLLGYLIAFYPLALYYSATCPYYSQPARRRKRRRH